MKKKLLIVLAVIVAICWWVNRFVKHLVQNPDFNPKPLKMKGMGFGVIVPKMDMIRARQLFLPKKRWYS